MADHAKVTPLLSLGGTVHTEACDMCQQTHIDYDCATVPAEDCRVNDCASKVCLHCNAPMKYYPELEEYRHADPDHGCPCFVAVNDLPPPAPVPVPDTPTSEAEVRALTREQCIAWLCWNDRNGCYSDADCRAEWGGVMTRDEAHESVIEQCRDDFTTDEPAPVPVPDTEKRFAELTFDRSGVSRSEAFTLAEFVTDNAHDDEVLPWANGLDALAVGETYQIAVHFGYSTIIRTA